MGDAKAYRLLDMGGIVSSIGKLLNSDAGRVLSGVATGGLSEAGRAAAVVAQRSGVDPTIASGLGAVTGSSLGLAGRATPIVPTTGSTATPGLAAPPIIATQALSKAATDTEGRAKASQQLALEASDAARTKRESDLNARTETPQEALDAKRRAGRTAQRLGGGQRRASQTLTSTSLGGY